MKAIAYISGILAISLLATSCDRKVKEERLQRIDSLEIHLQNSSEVLGQLDSMLIVNRLADIDRTGLWIYDNVTDTLERQPGIAFGDFMRTKKYYNQALTRYVSVSTEISYSEVQLQSLRSDVKNSFYSEQEFKGFFNAEAASIAKVVEATYELEEKYEFSNDRYAKFKPVVNSMVDSIKAIIYAPESVNP
ncbi:MAG: hypothetical protein HN542_08540 [Flavobacteriales bacterium]|jgi:hypothetical protein|nr:hypothetical protein [Flavobacteriales bacterium]NCG30779.1 hypothetical protein [Bacteroidota bacterium]MBT4705581.1 hypothetical protein [Flavobacteriales bacterium]MBT4931120.1 hypothetical protein [Flavobacteriales bacterium]MBT6131738.1 hypothetical protein [Flavobacteriales bacterium]